MAMSDEEYRGLVGQSEDEAIGPDRGQVLAILAVADRLDRIGDLLTHPRTGESVAAIFREAARL